jgi:hypothetical protein
MCLGAVEDAEGWMGGTDAGAVVVISGAREAVPKFVGAVDEEGAVGDEVEVNCVAEVERVLKVLVRRAAGCEEGEF